jgi:transposase
MGKAVAGEQAEREEHERIDVDLVAAQFEALDADTHRKALLEAIRSRDVYRRMIEELQEKIQKLEQGLLGPKSYRFKKGDDDTQLSLQLLAELLNKEVAADADAQELARELLAQIEADAQENQELQTSDGGGEDGGSGKTHHRSRKPTGRKAAREDLPKIQIEVLPDEVKRLGLDAFERIGEETSTTIERRVSSLVEVTVTRPKFRAKSDEAVDAVKLAREENGVTASEDPKAWITIAPPLALPIPRGIAGPGLLANAIVRRFDDHLPYNRLEGIYEREGMRLSRSTIYGWLDQLRELFAALIDAMRADAKTSPYLCVDATGVMVLAPEKCSRGHFWVLIAPERHVIFSFSSKHDSDAVDELLSDYEGYMVADAHSVYDHLYGDDGATEVGCWGHARAYFFKTLASEPAIAKEFLGNLRLLFLLERKFADKPRRQRERMRSKKAKALVDRHFDLCRKHDATALDGTPLRAAVTYSLNQEEALRRFLGDGRLPATNNISERELRRQATGRKNWLFVASDDGAEVNTTFTTLIASCHLNDIEPETYLRDVMCLLPNWSVARILELAPCNWKQTLEKAETQQILADSAIRNVILELDRGHLPEA